MLPLLRFTLDLFEQIQAPAQSGHAQDAITNDIKRVQTDLPHSAGSGGVIGGPGVSFRHPRASRDCRLGHVLVAYEFTRSARRSIGFSVGVDGLAVRAPKWVTLQAVDAALQAKSTWILRKLQEAAERKSRLPTPIDWRDGVVLPYLGQPLTLRLDPEHRFGVAGGHANLCSEWVRDGVPVSVLTLSLAHHATPAQIRDAAQAWLMRQARAHFVARLDHFAAVLGVRWTKLSLSQADTRWGSARLDGSIRLNWRLMHFSQPIIDYVVVHELSHLRVMNHSPQFWQTVSAVLPDYIERRKQLKARPAPSWR